MMENKDNAVQELSLDEMDQVSGGVLETTLMYCKNCGKTRVFILYAGGKALCTSCHKPGNA